MSTSVPAKKNNTREGTIYKERNNIQEEEQNTRGGTIYKEA
jgi:hypothetical protein